MGGREGGGREVENGAFWVEIRCRHCPQVKNAVTRVEASPQPIRRWMWCGGRSRDARFPFINEGKAEQLPVTSTSKHYQLRRETVRVGRVCDSEQ